MRAEIEVETSSFGTLSARVRFHADDSEKRWHHVWHLHKPNCNRMELFIHLVNRVGWRVSYKSDRLMRFEGDVPQNLVMVIETVLRMRRVRKEDMERWKMMTTDRIYDEVLPMAVAFNL